MTTTKKVFMYLGIAFAIIIVIGSITAIIGAFGVFGRIITGDFKNESAVSENTNTYALESEINLLECEINAADFVIKQGDSFYVESNLKRLVVEEKDGILRIKDKKQSNADYTNACLTLHIPVDASFDRVNITTGAGRLTVDCLNTDRLRLELGAGEVNITNLVSKNSAEIYGGAGQITISGGALNNLDMEMGAGQLNLSSALTGECEFDFGVGETNISVIGEKESYSLDIEKGIGTITVDGKSISGFEVDSGDDSETGNSIEINGGIGSINLKFE